MGTSSKLLLAALWLTLPLAAPAAVVTQYTGGQTNSSVTDYLGQSFTTPLQYFYSGVSFDFYSDSPAVTPAAAGTAFILSGAYAGTPSALGLNTPGFLAASTGVSGGVYTFNPSFVLAPGTTYFLYTNAVISPFSLSVNNGYAGGNLYAATSSSTGFASAASFDANFTLAGTAIGIPIPEPSAWVMMGAGVLALSAGQRIRRSVVRG